MTISQQKLEVYALSGGVGRHQVVGAALARRLPEEIDLPFPFPVRHAAVDLRHLSGEAHSLQPPDQKRRRVAMLRENDEFLIRVFRVPEDLAELFELGFTAGFVEGARFAEQAAHLQAFRFQLGQVGRHRSAHRAVLEVFVFLSAVRGSGLFVRGLRLEDVVQPVVQAALFPLQLFFGETPAPDVFDHPFDLLLPPFEGTQERVGRTGETALEDAHRQTHGRSIQILGAVVVVLYVARRFVVEFLLTAGFLTELVTQCIAVPLGIQGRPVEPDHLLLGAANEMPSPGLGRESFEGVVRR